MDVKPHRSYEQQLEILRERGLDVADRERALADLRNIGYYRLAAYWYPLREINRWAPDVTERSDRFVANASFEDARALWEFDHSLRLLLLEAMEYIEIAVRVRTSHCVGEHDPLAHLHPAQLDSDRCAEVAPSGDLTVHDDWVQRYEEKLATTQDDVLKLYREAWELKPPVWVAVELLDFGMLSTFFRFLTKAQQSAISRTFDISQGSFLTNWLKVFNHVRNMCAHHARVWNQPVTFRLQRIPLGLSPALDPLQPLTGTSKTRIYAVLHLCAYMIGTLGDEHEWIARVANLIRAFPATNRIAASQMGVPVDWQLYPIWRERHTNEEDD